MSGRILLCGVAVCLLLSFPSYAEEVKLFSADKLKFVNQDGIEYAYTRNGKLFSGAVIMPDNEGHKATYLYKDGRKNGVSSVYSEDKKLIADITYQNGLKNGVEKAYYPNGNPHYSRNYKNDIIDGVEIIFAENGMPLKQSQYTDGLLNGAVNYFDENGELSKIETYKNGIKDGIERIVKNKSLMAENNYTNGRLNGIAKRYNEKYLTDEISYVDGSREGLHKIYAADGSISEIPYRNDQKNGTATTYLPDKKILRTIVYADDMKNGTEREFRKDGTMISVINYSDDKPTGIARYFNEKNELTKVRYFGDNNAKGKNFANADINEIDLSNSEKIARIYQTYKAGKLGPLLKQRNLWYNILWLGLNTGDAKIIDMLEKAMKMYTFSIDDMEVYKRYTGADFDTVNEELFFGLTPFMYALTAPTPPSMVQKFASQREARNAQNETPLQYTVRINDAAATEYLLTQLTDNDKDVIPDLLFYALQHNDQTKIIKQLLDKIPDINIKDEKGLTALDYALSQRASFEILDTLTKAGADINQPQYENLLIKSLKEKADPEFITALLNLHAAATTTDDSGHSALYYADINGYSEQIKAAIIQNGAVLSAADKRAIIKNATAQNSAEILQKYNIPAAQWEDITDEGRSGLQYAYDLNAPESVILYFIESGADINHQDRNGNTIAHDAVIKGDYVTVLMLINRDASVNIANNYGKNIVYYVLTAEVPSELRNAVLRQVDADTAEMKMPETDTPLWKHLYQQNDWEALEKVISKAPNPLLLKDENGETLLDLFANNMQDNQPLKNIIAAHLPENNPDIIRKIAKIRQTDLLRQLNTDKSDMNAIDETGETLLTAAVKNNADIDFIRLLLEKGAQVNQNNADGENALDLALNSKNIATAAFLIENGADINKPHNDRTYLMDCDRNSANLTDLLIQNKADVSYVTSAGETALMAAVGNLNLPLVKYVLENGGDLAAQNSEGETAIFYLAKAAEKYGTEETERNDLFEIFKLLKENGADINSRDGNGQTILIVMARRYPNIYNDFKQIFNAAGGNRELKDQYGKTADEYFNENAKK